ncbi:Transcription factor [Penicillium taxi]|uniref:Transcription factor n=1 Tax=Penicillium taxi TaxID=168475 RepID=UPI0025459325|nr:Transcription factor [Penicillium taxi]KAJ5895128.1 Transcription factor [Penicillium taxi]
MRTTRPPRGPKKGHLRVLRNQLAALESRLNEQEKTSQRVIQLPSSGNCSCSTNRHKSTGSTSSSYDDEDLLQDAMDDLIMPTTIPMGLKPTALNVKVNPFDIVAPIEPSLDWTLNDLPVTDLARQDFQFMYQRDSLYRDTRQMLERLDSDDTIIDLAHIEQVQAWILLSTYEFMFNRYQRGLVSAGRAFRYIQLMRLYEIDSTGSAIKDKDFVEAETGRRTFWVAYMIDRFVSVKKGLPLTLNEQEIFTRLPAPEDKFQSSQSVVMSFLSEVIGVTDTGQISYKFSCPLTECVIVATIWGRSLMHKNSSQVKNVYGDATSEFWERHQWLDNTLRTHLQSLSWREQSNSGLSDPMLIFVMLITTTNILFLNNLIQSLPPGTEQWNRLVMEYRQLSLATTKDIRLMVEALTQLNHFQTHPFMPIPLSLCAEYILANPEMNESLRPQLLKILDVLHSLMTVNNLAQAYYPMLELDEMCLDYVNL